MDPKRAVAGKGFSYFGPAVEIDEDDDGEEEDAQDGEGHGEDLEGHNSIKSISQEHSSCSSNSGGKTS